MIKIDRNILVAFPDCTLRFYGDGIMTEYEDGASSYNFVPNDNGHFAFVAASIENYDSLLDYLFEHEFVHHFLCYKMFDQPSYVIRNAALNRPLDPIASGLEEKICYYFQRYMHLRCTAPDIQWIGWQGEAKAMLWPDIYGVDP
jgi:hypothetical protein